MHTGVRTATLVDVPQTSPTQQAVSVVNPSRAIWPGALLGLALALALSCGVRQSAAQTATTERARPANLERARRGIVSIERQGRRIGLGTVLNGDGRILTALSVLTHGNDLSVRYADGSLSRVRVVESDRAWDLALLIPLETNWKDGLKAARANLTSGANTLTKPVLGQSLRLAPVAFTSTDVFIGHDGAILNHALWLKTPISQLEIGTPLLDERLEVRALVARACAPKTEPCRLTPYGVPVGALRAFLKGVPRTAELPRPWLGVTTRSLDAPLIRGARITRVLPGSPADLAKLEAGQTPGEGDVIVAIAGTPVPTRQAFLDELGRHSIGETVVMLVFGRGKYRSVELALAAAPPGQAAAPSQKEGAGRRDSRQGNVKRNTTRPKSAPK